MTERSPMLPAELPAERSRSAALASAFARGAIAAGLGLGSLAVLVMVLWISSPYPDSGPDGAFHVATGLWLLAHGAELIRTDTLGGHPAPVGTVPLLLVVLPVWLVHRAARDSAETGGKTTDRHSAVGALCAVSAGYLLVVLAAAAYGRGGGLPVDRTTLAFPVLLVVTGSAAAGVWAARGRPVTSLLVWAPLSLQEAAARSRFRAGAVAALRSAAFGVLVLLAGGAVLVVAALGLNAGAARGSLLGLSGDWAGRSALLLLAVALLPNAAMWGAAYGMGPGFALGTASTVTPFAFAGHPALPDFPLLAAMPSQGPGTAVNWVAAAVPAAAALAVARRVARSAAPSSAGDEEPWGQGRTTLVAGLAAVGCGAGVAALAAASGGPLGTGALAEFGPVWWLVGPASLVWTAVIGVPSALLLRAWRLREKRWGWRRDAAPQEADAGSAVAPEEKPAKGATEREGDAEAGAANADEEPYGFLAAGSWHEDGARKARWAALRESSGGLMAHFPAVPDPAPGRAPTPGARDAETEAGAGAAEPGAEAAGHGVLARPAAAGGGSTAASGPAAAPDPGAAAGPVSAPVSDPAAGDGPPVPGHVPPAKHVPVAEYAPDSSAGPCPASVFDVPPAPAQASASATSPVHEPDERSGPGPNADRRPDPGRESAP
ncbi:DUF6350 family protein [Streptomyces sp. NPDC057428]|uniref:cell division protein PerM n=1 Tax=Streptomyces sp. NPDC057428 TaxID=3346129 RepID=UPI0036CB71DF